MDIDLKQGTITFRILYRGPAGSTKFLNLRALGKEADPGADERLSVLCTQEDRVLTTRIRCVPDEPALLGLRPLFLAMTAPGRLRSSATGRLLLEVADAVVFLPDREHPAGRESRRELAALVADLEQMGRRPGEVPLVIQDYSDGEPRIGPECVDRRTARWSPVFTPVEGDTRQGVRRVFAATRKAIEGRVGRLEDAYGVEAARAASRARALGGAGRQGWPERLVLGTALLLALAAGAAVLLAVSL